MTSGTSWDLFVSNTNDLLYSYLIQIIRTQFSEIKYSYQIQIICLQLYLHHLHQVGRIAQSPWTPLSLSLSLSLYLSIYLFIYDPSFLTNLDCTLCPDRVDRVDGQPTLVCPCVGVHRRRSFMSSIIMYIYIYIYFQEKNEIRSHKDYKFISILLRDFRL